MAQEGGALICVQKIARQEAMEGHNYGEFNANINNGLHVNEEDLIKRSEIMVDLFRKSKQIVPKFNNHQSLSVTDG